MNCKDCVGLLSFFFFLSGAVLPPALAICAMSAHGCSEHSGGSISSVHLSKIVGNLGQILSFARAKGVGPSEPLSNHNELTYIYV